MTVDAASVPLDELTPYSNNPRQGDVGAIAVSLEANGQYRPIVVNRRDMQILAGNHTFHAARSLGWDTIDVTYVDVDDSTARRIVLVDNRTNDLAAYDDQVLADMLTAIHEAEGPDGWVGTGFDGDDVDELLADLDTTSPWDDRRLQTKPDPGIVEPGQVWQVGRHLLACGDSRDPDLWRRLLGDDRAALMFTDPPYGIDYGGGGVEREKLEGDSSVEEACTLLDDVLDAVGPVMTEGAASYVCLPPCEALVPLAWRLQLRGLYRWGLVWVKDRQTFGRSDYHPRHEMIIYGWWPTGPHHKVADRTQTTVWEVPRPSDSDMHPTAKPPELAVRAIVNSTPSGSLVVDPFAGSASTLVAAERTGRGGVGVELDPGYVRAALDWLALEAGVPAVLVDD